MRRSRRRASARSITVRPVRPWTRRSRRSTPMALMSTRCACAHFRSPIPSPNLLLRTTPFSWSSRTATRSCTISSSTSSASIPRGSYRCCITMARRLRRASLPVRSTSRWMPPRSRRSARARSHEHESGHCKPGFRGHRAARARRLRLALAALPDTVGVAGVGRTDRFRAVPLGPVRAERVHAVSHHPARLAGRRIGLRDRPGRTRVDAIRSRAAGHPVMTYIAKPKLHPPTLACNAAGFTRRDYEGAVSTLCAGCGHDSISAAIIQACWELDIQPHRVAKLSGIGCSSKTPTYFLGQSHGFNTVHGRMPSVLTGANLANKELLYLGVSGDGDSASIGIGQFVHAIRRGVNMVYIVENNGVYGLTKGQFSATADLGSKSKKGVTNTDSPLDMVGLALQLGASFVARGFSGDKPQLVPLIKAAIKHRGAAFIDVISPCVAFNNHPGSTKSYDYVREHNEAANRLDFIDGREEISIDYAEGELI